MPKVSIAFHLYPGTSLLNLLAGAILCGKETAGTWRVVEFENGKSAMGCTMMSREQKTLHSMGSRCRSTHKEGLCSTDRPANSRKKTGAVEGIGGINDS